MKRAAGGWEDPKRNALYLPQTRLPGFCSFGPSFIFS